MDSAKIVTVNLEAKPEKTVDKVESFDEYGSGSFISGEVSEMMLGVGVRLRVYGVVGTCIGMFDDGHRIA